VTGEVRVRLDHGSAVVVGRRSPRSLYDRSLATYDTGDLFDHASAIGFINLWGLPVRTEAGRDQRAGGANPAAQSALLTSLPVEVTDAVPANEASEAPISTASVG
jgi:hypothetical protein